jgi:hypothetical protein
MEFLKKNWIWILAIPAAVFFGWEMVSFVTHGASSNWVRRLWKKKPVDRMGHPVTVTTRQVPAPEAPQSPASEPDIPASARPV